MTRVEVDFWRDSSAAYIPYWEGEKVNTESYSLKKLDSVQPEYVCQDCIREYSYHQTLGGGNDKGFSREFVREEFKSHNGKCECCNRSDIDLYKAKDVGYFYQGWQNRKYRP